MGDWKADRKGAEGAWELYDLSKDISEATDVAAQHSEVMEKMRKFAADAHTPMPQGEIHDRALIEKDRKYFAKPAQPKARTKAPKKTAEQRIHQTSSEWDWSEVPSRDLYHIYVFPLSAMERYRIHGCNFGLAPQAAGHRSCNRDPFLTARRRL
jgi:hypothetical protein